MRLTEINCRLTGIPGHDNIVRGGRIGRFIQILFKDLMNREFFGPNLGHSMDQDLC
jgi:hypothetical protein